jgi:hypothetical protein
MKNYIGLGACTAIITSNGLIVADAFADNRIILGAFALLLSNLACFIAGIIVSEY